MLEHLVGSAELLHPARDALAAEETHQVILERDEELGAAGIALTAGAAAQLAIDATRFVALGAENVQSPKFLYTRTELDVGAASGHVRRDRHRSLLPGA